MSNQQLTEAGTEMQQDHEATSPARRASEIEIQLDALEFASARLADVLGKFNFHLEFSGALVPPTTDPEGACSIEQGPASQLGHRIYCDRVVLHDIAAEFESLLARLAV